MSQPLPLFQAIRKLEKLVRPGTPGATATDLGQLVRLAEGHATDLLMTMRQIAAHSSTETMATTGTLAAGGLRAVTAISFLSGILFPPRTQPFQRGARASTIAAALVGRAGRARRNRRGRDTAALVLAGNILLGLRCDLVV
jgi:hypothetical protein